MGRSHILAAAVVLSAAEFADAVICTCYNWEGTDEDNAALVCDKSKLVQLNDAGEITGTPCERAALNKLEYSIQVCPSRPLARNRLRRPGAGAAWPHLCDVCRRSSRTEACRPGARRPGLQP
jgi:hypothetical protein